MIKEQINKDYMKAFKERDTVKKNLLSVVKGEIQTQEKNQSIDNMSDEDVTKILNKMAKSLREVFVTDSSQVLTDVKIELDIIEAYLPKPMSSEEISLKLEELYGSGITQMGDIMKAFSTLPADKKVVSELIKNRN
ncbi:COG1610 Uncharacterized conserved protein [uncultured Caudovirales phage]|uniref:COG1610 Uncharacterized conserved protein n=1 Tax=uncultured Caudovirales phage TaxID=2100421 RepID=A0A6J5RHQ5_9CAUD|nr:COG1610 Uncharacterized conserved protein [uncultured Caudovirales phage]CAB4193797.1 COG1610 Uncharacterized conserved protein [uncultured Caudovirales phage]